MTNPIVAKGALDATPQDHWDAPRRDGAIKGYGNVTGNGDADISVDVPLGYIHQVDRPARTRTIPDAIVRGATTIVFYCPTAFSDFSGALSPPQHAGSPIGTHRDGIGRTIPNEGLRASTTTHLRVRIPAFMTSALEQTI